MRQLRRRLSVNTVRYGARCLSWRRNPLLMCCPSCQCASGVSIARKAWITDLVCCDGCRLLYRRPQEPEGFGERFYQREYDDGLTTEPPERTDLAAMLSSNFRNTEKDLSQKIAVFSALGVPRGARILDYGSSWGYGVWQLSAAGYRADGFEVSRTRAAYGMRHLGVRIHSDASELSVQSYDAVMTNHVLEHIPNPKVAFEQISSVLKPGGWVVAFFPNGSDACRLANPARFECNWGRLHPVYLNNEYCARLLKGRPFWMMGKKYESPPDLQLLSQWNGASEWMGDLSENEMILVARF